MKICNIINMCIPDSWVQREIDYNCFISLYKLDKEHYFYYYHDGFIYAFNYLDHVVDYCKIPDKIKLNNIGG